MAGRGRGRGLTLPAWMTNGTAEESIPTATEQTTSVVVSSAEGISTSASSTSNGDHSRQMNVDAASQFLQAESKTEVSGAPQPHSAPHRPTATSTTTATTNPTYQQPQQPAVAQQPYQYQQYQQPPQQFSYNPQMQPGTAIPPHMAYAQGGYPPHMFQSQQPRGPPFMPPAGVPMGYPQAPAQTQTPQPPTLNDPLNDVKSWSEHVSEEDKRVYWHNKVTKTSTYDKPECLKCPEERSIPPCRWKQYSKDGKIYYSDGKDSVWTVPEEFRVWKERVDAAVERRKNALGGPQASQQQSTPKANVVTNPTASSSTSVSEETDESSAQKDSSTSTSVGKPSPAKTPVVEEEVLVYASEKEAVAAFKQLLADRDVTAVMKFKDVQELCQRDARWKSCKSVGARKQALSEYQTQKMKAEREEKRLQARKNRDMFFQLLAETTAIDSRTRWRDAQPLLQESRRYKQIEDDREREDYFTEFVVELAKKEKEDLRELKKLVKVSYVEILDDLFSVGKIKRNAIWADVKDEILGRLDSKLNTLDDADKRHMFQDYMLELDTRLRLQEKAEEEERARVLQAFQKDFREHMMGLVSTGEITVQIKWRDVKPVVASHPTFVALMKFLEDVEVSRAGPSAAGTISSSCKGGPRDVFDEILADVQKAEREDKRVLQRVFEDGFEFKNRDTGTVTMLVDPVEHDTTFSYVKAQIEAFVINTAVTEGDRLHKYKAPLDDMLSQRCNNLESYFKKFVDDKVEEKRAREKRQRKYEDRYLDLLDDFYYRSDHVGMEWEEAKRELSRYSAYQDLSRELRKSLFMEHMEELAAELAKKPSTLKDKSSHVSNGGSVSMSMTVEHEEGEVDDDEDSEKRVEKEKVNETGESRIAGHKRSASPPGASSISRSRSRSSSRSLHSRGHSVSRSRSRSRSYDGRGHSTKGNNRDRDRDRDEDSSRHSRESSKRKRRDSKSDVRDESDDESGRGRKSKKSKREKKDKKEKKSHKHSHKHKSHRDSSRDRRC